MTDEQLAKIKEAAAKATPGPWETSGVRSRFPNVDSLWITINGERVIGLLCGSDKDYALSFRDQHHIATSNPKAVLDLIARLEAAEARALSAYNEGIEAAVKCQPTTAENPYESAYQRGRFDAILKYTHAIRALLKDKQHG